MGKDNKIQNVFPDDVSNLTVESIFDALVDAYSTKVLRLAYTYVKDQKTAEDITQEVFIRCYQKWDQFRGDAHIKTWIYSITINLCKDYLKSWSFRNLLFIEVKERKNQLKEQSVIDKVLDLAEKKLLSNLVMELPIKYREIIILHYYEDYSMEEISQILNLNSNTARTRLRRAREKLQKQYLIEKRDG